MPASDRPPGFVCFVPISQRAGGPLGEFTDISSGRSSVRWSAPHRPDFPDGYPVYGHVGLTVLGLAVGAPSDTAAERNAEDDGPMDNAPQDNGQAEEDHAHRRQPESTRAGVSPPARPVGD